MENGHEIYLSNDLFLFYLANSFAHDWVHDMAKDRKRWRFGKDQISQIGGGGDDILTPLSQYGNNKTTTNESTGNLNSEFQQEQVPNNEHFEDFVHYVQINFLNHMNLDDTSKTAEELLWDAFESYWSELENLRSEENIIISNIENEQNFIELYLLEALELHDHLKIHFPEDNLLMNLFFSDLLASKLDGRMNVVIGGDKKGTNEDGVDQKDVGITFEENPDYETLKKNISNIFKNEPFENEPFENVHNKMKELFIGSFPGTSIDAFNPALSIRQHRPQTISTLLRNYKIKIYDYFANLKKIIQPLTDKDKYKNTLDKIKTKKFTKEESKTVEYLNKTIVKIMFQLLGTHDKNFSRKTVEKENVGEKQIELLHSYAIDHKLNAEKLDQGMFDFVKNTITIQKKNIHVIDINTNIEILNDNQKYIISNTFSPNSYKENIYCPVGSILDAIQYCKKDSLFGETGNMHVKIINNENPNCYYQFKYTHGQGNNPNQITTNCVFPKKTEWTCTTDIHNSKRVAASNVFKTVVDKILDYYNLKKNKGEALWTSLQQDQTEYLELLKLTHVKFYGDGTQELNACVKHGGFVGEKKSVHEQIVKYNEDGEAKRLYLGQDRPSANRFLILRYLSEPNSKINFQSHGGYYHHGKNNNFVVRPFVTKRAYSQVDSHVDLNTPVKKQNTSGGTKKRRYIGTRKWRKRGNTRKLVKKSRQGVSRRKYT